MSKRDIRVFENNAPLKAFRVRVKNSDGSYSPRKLDSPNMDDIKFYAKAARADLDSSALFTYTLTGGQITVTNDGTGAATYGEFTVQFNATHTATTRILFYHVDVVKTSRPDTVAHGFLEIYNL